MSILTNCICKILKVGHLRVMEYFYSVILGLLHKTVEQTQLKKYLFQLIV